MDAFAKLGADTFWSVYQRAAGHGETLDRYLATLDEIESRLAGPGDAAGFRRLLDRLDRDDPAAWLEVENARRAQAGDRPVSDWARQLGSSPQAQRGLDRLLRRDQDAMVHSLIDVQGAETGLISDPEVVLALEQIAELSDRELDGLLELRRYVDRGGSYGGFPQWDEILFTEPARRRNLLELIADLHDPANPASLVVTDGMADVLTAALRHGGDIQGGIGHLQAARSLLREFPGARMRFEVTQLTGGVQREVDIVLEVAGRNVDVEVKSYQASTALTDKVRRQISKDLERHLGDPAGPWSDLLWRFPDPSYAANLPAVERVFAEELEKLHAQGKLTGPLAQWQADLDVRFRAPVPWQLIDVLH